MNNQEKNKKMKKLESLATVHTHTPYSLKDEKVSLEKRNLQKGVTLIALIIIIVLLILVTVAIGAIVRRKWSSK